MNVASIENLFGLNCIFTSLGEIMIDCSEIVRQIGIFSLFYFYLFSIVLF